MLCLIQSQNDSLPLNLLKETVKSEFMRKAVPQHSTVNKFWSRRPHWERRWQATFWAPKAQAS